VERRDLYIHGKTEGITRSNTSERKRTKRFKKESKHPKFVTPEERSYRDALVGTGVTMSIAVKTIFGRRGSSLW